MNKIKWHKIVAHASNKIQNRLNCTFRLLWYTDIEGVLIDSWPEKPSLTHQMFDNDIATVKCVELGKKRKIL